MNVLENVYLCKTTKGSQVIVRADSEKEATDRVEDYLTNECVCGAYCLADYDNDYGVIPILRISVRF